MTVGVASEVEMLHPEILFIEKHEKSEGVAFCVAFGVTFGVTFFCA